jgi:hypothetical protein
VGKEISSDDAKIALLRTRKKPMSNTGIVMRADLFKVVWS